MAKTAGVSVAGMHRSGTSMVTALLMRCGLALGDDADLIQPSYANEAGYWENRGFVELNEQVLAATGGAWDRVPRFPPAKSRLWKKDALVTLAAQATSLQAAFPATGQWG